MSDFKMSIEIEPTDLSIVTQMNGVTSRKHTTLEEVQRILSRDRSLQTPLLPGHWGTQMYAMNGSRELYVMSTPPHVRTVSYDYRGEGGDIKEFKIPLPPLLWLFNIGKNSGGELRLRHTMVYALRNWVMSDRDNLFYFPFPNVSDYCCWGDNTPRLGTAKSITSLPDQFFNGHFNSDLDGDRYSPFHWEKNGRRIQAFRGSHLLEYLHEMQALAEAKGENAEFNYDCLRRYNSLTVADGIRRALDRLNG